MSEPILEHAVLKVKPSLGDAFLAAFAEARQIIAAAPGCRAVQLSRCVEDEDRFLLLVEWDSLEAHLDGFRGSEPYQRWKELLHHFYDPFPTVDHYRATL
jgi:heme-degrading monooxygenase HmoA